MFSRGIRAARKPLCEAERFMQFQNMGDWQESKPADTSQAEELNGIYGSGGGSIMHKAENFVRAARRSASKPKITYDGTLGRQCQRADGQQTHRPVAIVGGHHEARPPPHSAQDEGHNLKSKCKSNVRAFVEQQAQPWIDHNTEMLQAELAEFWAQRAHAREEYRRSKALREAKAKMESTAPAARPAGRAPRASSELAAAARARVQ